MQMTADGLLSVSAGGGVGGSRLHSEIVYANIGRI